MKMQNAKKNSKVGGVGCGESGCERRSEVIVKIKKEIEGGGGRGFGSGVGVRVDVYGELKFFLTKIQKEKKWGGGGRVGAGGSGWM